MPNFIRVDTDFKSHRRDRNGALNRALENRRSYLGFILGMTATVIVVLAVIGWSLQQSGLLHL